MIDLYETCLTIARITGKEYGYAIGLHGTAMRDLDLIAVPWTDTARDPLDFLHCLAGRIEEETKRGILVEGEPVTNEWPKPEAKPHGRIAWTILLGGPFWLDISVMPRVIQKCSRCGNATHGNTVCRDLAGEAGLPDPYADTRS